MEETFEIGGQVVTLQRVNKSNLQPGDHVFSFRLGGLYSHHGIYVGNGQVIHFNTPREVIAALAKENPNVPFDGEDDIWDPVANGSPGLGIVKTGIDHFGSKIYLYKYGVSWIEFWLRKRGTCCPYKSKSLKEAVDTAKEKLKTGFGTYNLLTNNCEHFATYCRTGIKFSGQVIPRYGDMVQQLPICEIEKITSGTYVNVNV